jgi:hypothetical protein
MGHQHPNLDTALRNTMTFLTTAHGLTEDQAAARIREILAQE